SDMAGAPGSATVAGGGLFASVPTTVAGGSADGFDTYAGGWGGPAVETLFHFNAAAHGLAMVPTSFGSAPATSLLVGYDPAAAAANAMAPGNALLRFGDGTTVTLTGFSHTTVGAQG